MNTIRSVWFGWGTLIVAGGGAYYFAKRSIASDRAERAAADRRRREASRNLEYSATTTTSSASSSHAPSHPPPSTTAKSSSKHTNDGVSAEVARRRGRDGSGHGDGDGAGAGPSASGGELAASPSSEASLDPAPTRHAPETVGQRVGEKTVNTKIQEAGQEPNTIHYEHAPCECLVNAL
ncbi:hypothetical protein EV356DRAFT_571467 [Viridothelium virens]|uniref:Uncharacterized protein n=1 Tax=Viridothelium virens TaxID=1048519 RepID=A0A6A6GT94_VIRVR|nr:hypothetical protein EV356DRAFT_571467 [Viridothelium virens]